MMNYAPNVEPVTGAIGSCFDRYIGGFGCSTYCERGDDGGNQSWIYWRRKVPCLRSRVPSRAALWPSMENKTHLLRHEIVDALAGHGAAVSSAVCGCVWAVERLVKTWWDESVAAANEPDSQSV